MPGEGHAGIGLRRAGDIPTRNYTIDVSKTFDDKQNLNEYATVLRIRSAHEPLRRIMTSPIRSRPLLTLLILLVARRNPGWQRSTTSQGAATKPPFNFPRSPRV